MTKIKMALALDKLIKDVKEEKILWKENQSHTTDEEENAWNRVATKNSLSGGEAKSIFKVLCKKYRQEAQKPVSSWQLFDTLKFLDEKSTTEDSSIKNEIMEQADLSPDSNHEEETFVELLEVKDEDFSDDGDDDADNNSNGKKNETKPMSAVPIKKERSIGETKSNVVLLNSEGNQKSLGKASHQQHHDKSIEKQINNISKENSHHNNSTSNSGNHNNSNAVTDKHQHQNQTPTLPPSITIKKEKDNNTISSPITLSSVLHSLKRKYQPENVQQSTGNNNSSAHNGNTHQKDSDLQHDIPEKRRVVKTLLTTSSPLSGHHNQQQKQQKQHLTAQELIKNINADIKISTESPATVKNQTNTTINSVASSSSSSIPTTANNNISTNLTESNDEYRKFSSFGNYVATTMNRLTPKLAAKLEIKILQAIIDINSEMMNRF